VFRSLVDGLFIGTLYLSLSSNGESHCYYDRMSLFYCGVAGLLYDQVQYLSIYIQNRPIYVSERDNKAYGPLAYHISLATTMLPVQLVNVLVYCGPVYVLAGLRLGFSHFALFYLFHVLTAVSAHYLAMLSAALSGSSELALITFNKLVCFLILYSGFPIYISSIQIWENWLPYFSFLRYSFQGLMLNELQGNSQLTNESYYVDALGFDSLSIGACAGILCLFSLALAAFFYFALFAIDFEIR
jgi:ATP-binding cassette, subfamily G (WHITE), member 2